MEKTEGKGLSTHKQSECHQSWGWAEKKDGHGHREEKRIRGGRGRLIFKDEAYPRSQRSEVPEAKR